MKHRYSVLGRRTIAVLAGLILCAGITAKAENVKADVVTTTTIPDQTQMQVQTQPQVQDINMNTGVYLSYQDLLMAPATTQKLKLYGAYGDVEWFCDDENVATVSASGKITARKKGTAQVIANYNGVDYACNLTVDYESSSTPDGMQYMDTKGTFGKSGRWFKKSIDGGKYYFTNTEGSAIYFKVTGSKYVQVDFVSRITVSTPYFAYSVDGGKMKRQLISDEKISVGNTKTHYVRILLDGMSESESRWGHEAGIGIKNIKPVTKSGVVAAIEPENPTIAFYGDSITQGVRALNMALAPSGTSATNTFAWHCAQYLEMVPYYAGYGGAGIVQSGCFSNCYNSIVKYSSGRKAADFDADVIVIEHGTNDVYSHGEGYVNAYKKVLSLLHKKHPDAQIMAMIPFTQEHAADIRKAVDSMGDWCTVVETSSWRIAYTDGLHPNVSGAKTAGKKLAKKILATGKVY